MVTLWLLFGIYIMVLIAILADLWSGVRKAKQNNIVRSSYGFKRTVDKIARYYNVLLALTVVDTMQMGALWYLETYYDISFPMFPFVTLIGAIGIALIEIKSIFEKAEDKVQFEHIGTLAGRVIANKDDLAEVGRAIVDYMTEKDNKEKSKSDSSTESTTGN